MSMTEQGKVSTWGSKEKTHAKRMQDEVYRGMFLVEEGRPGAQLRLALALLRAWQANASDATSGKQQEWPKKVSPICIEMLDGPVGGGGTAI